MNSDGDMIDTAELAIRLRDWGHRATNRWWQDTDSERPSRGRVTNDEIDDEDGPESWPGLFA